MSWAVIIHFRALDANHFPIILAVDKLTGVAVDKASVCVDELMICTEGN